ncbi:MAG: aminotransferase, partial [Gaiellales bacterium]
LPRDLTDDARRLDVSLAWLVAAAARRSLELIVAIGPKRIAAHDLGLARGFAEQLGLPLPSSPIVRLEVESAAGLADSLGEAGISCSVRAGSVRLSFHLYNDEADVERVVDVLRRAGLRA